MSRQPSGAVDRDAPPPFAVILGTNEIASAAAVELRRAGWLVVLSHDPFPPVIRRAMAFHDVLFGDRIVIEGIKGEPAETARDIATVLAEPDQVATTALPLTDLLTIRSLDVLIDARMQKHRVTPDLRHLARVTIGLGPQFAVGMNCDIAVETRPAHAGNIVTMGSTEAADGKANPLGGVGAERFVYADKPGLWHASIDIGVRVFKDFVVGHLDGLPVRAPFDGIVRGIVRDGLHIPANVKVLELDPRRRAAQWSGIDERGRCIAQATMQAIRIGQTRRHMQSTPATTFW